MSSCVTGKSPVIYNNIYIGPVFVQCQCGPNYPTDEDGCCLMCGDDALTIAHECSVFSTGKDT